MLGRFATAGVAVGKFRSHAQVAADNEEFARELEESATSQSTKNLFKGILKKPSTYYGAKDRPMLERENSTLAHLEEIAKSMGLNDKELSDLSQLSSDFNVYIVVDDSDIMKKKSMPQKDSKELCTRWEEAIRTLEDLMSVLQYVQPHGVQIQFLNAKSEQWDFADKIIRYAAVKEKMEKVQPNGPSKLNFALFTLLEYINSKTIAKGEEKSKKNLVIVICGGMPSDGPLSEMQKMLLDDLIFKPPNADGEGGTFMQFVMCTENEHLVHHYAALLDEKVGARVDVVDDYLTERTIAIKEHGEEYGKE